MRCRGCDSVLQESEIIYRKDIQQWEDLCRTCRKYAYPDAENMHNEIDSSDIEVMDIMSEELQ